MLTEQVPAASDNVRVLWAELNGCRRFSLSELVPAQGTIHSLL